MWDFSILKGTQALEKSLPYTIHRLVRSFAMAASFLFALLFGAGTGLAVGARSGFADVFAGLGGLVGLGLCGWWVYRSRHERLLGIKSGSIVVLAAVLDNEALPAGQAQIEAADQTVRDRFESAQVLSALNQRVQTILVDLMLQPSVLGQRITVPTHPWAARGIRGLLGALWPHANEVVLAVCLREQDQPVESCAATALTLFAQNVDRLWKNSLSLLLWVTAGWLLVFCLVWVPVGWALDVLPVAISALWQVVFTLILSWALKAAYFDPIAFHALLQAYVRITQGQQVDDQKIRQLAERSPDFQAILRAARTE